MKNIILQKQGILQALGVAAYCSLIGTFMWNAEWVFGKMNNFVGPILILTLLATSVLTCGSIVFYAPYKLFLKGKGGEAINVVVSTAIWLFILLILAFLAIFLINR